jgi:hypothetical protein
MTRQWLSEHSSLYMGAQYILHSNNYLLIIGSKMGIIHPIERRSNLSTITPDLLEKTANELQVIQSLQGGNVLFVIVPFFDQFLPNLATTQKNSEAIYDSFMGRLRERHINAINSLPFFRAEAVEHSLIFGHDLLWNDNAHLATARAIAERLK